jgi:hypothetical protein
MINPIQIWKEKGKILEGVMNNIFKTEHVEDIMKQRQAVCNVCTHLDALGNKCAIPGTGPCCGDCGCSLKLKLRSLSSECSRGFWKAEMTQKEEDLLNKNLKNK